MVLKSSAEHSFGVGRTERVLLCYETGKVITEVFEIGHQMRMIVQTCNGVLTPVVEVGGPEGQGCCGSYSLFDGDVAVNNVMNWHAVDGENVGVRDQAARPPRTETIQTKQNHELEVVVVPRNH